jgi:predicted RNase H-like nuclease
MSVVLGADGVTRNRWVVAELPDRGPVTWHLVTGAAAVLRLADAVAAAAVALDVPIGLPSSAQRRCDIAARDMLGPRRSSVFMTPPRHALEHLTYGAARAASPGLTAQAYALFSRIRDVDDALRSAGPGIHDRVIECHPEVSFQELAGVELPRKRSSRGALDRIDALTAVGLIGVDLTELRAAPDEAGLDDVFDAVACAWTARRWAAREARTLGGEPDELGVPMRIVC